MSYRNLIIAAVAALALAACTETTLQLKARL